MAETVVQAALQAVGILAGALGYHLTKVKPTPKFLKPMTMQDSVTLANLEEGYDAYIAYVEGWPEVTPAKVQAKFPGKLVLTFTTNPRYHARFLDVERGAANVLDIPGWDKMMRTAGNKRPGYYASLANMPAVIRALKAQGLTPKQYLLIVADWDGVATIPRGYNGKQYRNTPGYDLSVIGRRAFG